MPYDEDDNENNDDSKDIHLWLNKQDGLFRYESYRPGVDCGIPTGFYELISTRDGWAANAITMRQDMVISDEDNALIQSVFAETDVFWNSSDFYNRAKLAYKRGYLFHGRPGTGKSVLLRHMAQRFVTQGAVVVKGNSPPLVSHFMKALAKTQPQHKMVVLFDDLDTIVSGWEDELLELMDGLVALPTGVLWIGATNYIDQIPDRLKKRPSRFDRLIEVSSLSDKVRRQYILQICPELKDSRRLEDMVKASVPLVFAELKEMVLAHVLYGETLESILARLSENPLTENDSDDDEEEEDPVPKARKRAVVGSRR